MLLLLLPLTDGLCCPSACRAQEMAGAHPPSDVAWALSLVHSRSFVERSAHIWCPGIDLCNHTLAPNADIRWRGRPLSCRAGRKGCLSWHVGPRAAPPVLAPVTPESC